MSETKRDTFNDKEDNKHKHVVRIVEAINDYTKTIVDNALKNLTEFCSHPKSAEFYQRSRCSWNYNNDRCRQTYRCVKIFLINWLLSGETQLNLSFLKELCLVSWNIKEFTILLTCIIVTLLLSYR